LTPPYLAAFAPPLTAELSVALPDGVVVRGHEVRALAALVRALRGELPALASLSCPIN